MTFLVLKYVVLFFKSMITNIFKGSTKEMGTNGVVFVTSFWKQKNYKSHLNVFVWAGEMGYVLTL